MAIIHPHTRNSVTFCSVHLLQSHRQINTNARALWVQGTFGTGKSHASSVVRHLICDDLSQIEAYLKNIDDDNLRNQVFNFRKNKRFFSVVIKGC